MPPLSVIAVPAIIPVVVVSSPAQVTVEVASVIVAPVLAVNFPVMVIAAVNVSVAVTSAVMLFSDMLADGVLIVHDAPIFTVEPVVVIAPLDHSSVLVLKPTEPTIATVPASVTLLATYPVVHPVDCHVPPLSTTVIPVMIPEVVVSIPAHVSADEASVSVTEALACIAPVSVVADVSVSVDVAVAMTLLSCKF